MTGCVRVFQARQGSFYQAVDALLVSMAREQGPYLFVTIDIAGPGIIHEFVISCTFGGDEPENTGIQASRDESSHDEPVSKDESPSLDPILMP